MASRYHLEKLIARGGMAEVHLARVRGEAGFTKLVALKRILETYADNAQLNAMFMDEARLAARLSHANVVQVFDFGRDEQGYFIAMEYVPGPDLATVLRVLRQSGERPPEAAMVDVVLQVLRGLDHAHRLTGPDGLSLNVIHRDVSPGNVLLTAEGTAKLSDFGVARTTERLAENTRAGKTKGKAAYMSPEQARSKPLDPRSDVFSAGLLLWETLAGQRCYQAADDASLIRMAAQAEVRALSSVGVEVEAPLAAVIDRALQKDAEKRWPSAAAMAEELEAFHRSAYPRYTQAALGQVVARALTKLPPLPHLNLPALSGEQPVEQPAPPPAANAATDKLPAGKPRERSVRRPRAQLAETKDDVPAAAKPQAAPAPTAPEPPKAPSTLKLAAVVIGVALVVVGVMTALDRREEPPPGPPDGAFISMPVVPKNPLPPVPTPTPRAPSDPNAVEVRTPGPATNPEPHGKGTGYLSVKCDPWCDIYIDHNPTPHRSPAERIPLPAGSHRLRLVNPTVHLSKSASVTVRADENVSRYFNLVLNP